MNADLVHTISAQEPSAVPVNVLIADDDAMFRMILRTWLERWGYRVTIAENGAEAWDLLQQENAPQLLILDWMMPEISGVELCSLVRLRPETNACYILLATSKDHTHDLIQGLEAGADDYLSKPFDKNELQARLETGRRILMAQQ